MFSLPSGISTIVFDLGGVIVDLSVSRTLDALSELSKLPQKQIVEAYFKHPEFFAYERGEISDAEFRTMLRRIFSLQTASDAELDQSWNAMLLGVPDRNLKLLDRLKSSFQVFALSNTNNIHIQCLNNVFLNGQLLETHFHKSYYSHEVGMRKPEPDIYKYVLHDAGLHPEETFFLDDNVENIKAANLLGIQTMHVTHPDRVLDLLN